MARRAVHGLRARHDAVMVGGGTVRADDPLLTVRGLGVRRQPMRVVVSQNLDLPENGVLAQSVPEVPLLLCHGDAVDPNRVAVWEAKGAKCASLPVREEGGVNVDDLMKTIGNEGITRVFCEGGGQFAASLLNAGYVDEVIGFNAGLALGSDGKPMLGTVRLAALADAPRFDLVECRALGPDLMHRWRRCP